jgi:hypothetical protein
MKYIAPSLGESANAVKEVLSAKSLEEAVDDVEEEIIKALSKLC